MSHHKRGRPKARRAGCEFCKPHKRSGACATKMRTAKQRAADVTRKEQMQ